MAPAGGFGWGRRSVHAARSSVTFQFWQILQYLFCKSFAIAGMAARRLLKAIEMVKARSRQRRDQPLTGTPPFSVR
jgi:hypothetical protein